jgi:hypothetical protein
LCGIRDDAPRERRTGRCKIPNQGNGLSRVGRNLAKSNINCADKSCGKLEAKRVARISLRQSRDGDVATGGSAKNAVSTDWQEFFADCHAAERFGREGFGTSLINALPTSPFGYKYLQPSARSSPNATTEFHNATKANSIRP